ncbi:hypothetical protein OHV05_36330 (plasmid) [Kitasatospora sp. NBC_00070]|uniref:hypothetical protein n=1 Tax=Kitasatospora sp. NBC_00070 TaxID=2975962 RepID=UPI002F910A43
MPYASMIKRYAADAERVTERAAEIARMADDSARWTALTALFRDCGKMAAVYADPDGAVVALVEDVAEVFHAERYAVRHPVQELAA